MANGTSEELQTRTSSPYVGEDGLRQILGDLSDYLKSNVVMRDDLESLVNAIIDKREAKNNPKDSDEPDIII